jgi:hypothetical protein
MKKRALGIALAGALTLSSLALAATPSGTYKAKVRSRAYNGALDGTWTVTLYKGKYTVTDNGTVVLQGKYSISGTRITIGGGGHKAFCQVTGVYTFKLSGNKLSFGKVSDRTAKCAGRRIVLTSGAFTKVG